MRLSKKTYSIVYHTKVSYLNYNYWLSSFYHQRFLREQFFSFQTVTCFTSYFSENHLKNTHFLVLKISIRCYNLDYCKS